MKFLSKGTKTYKNGVMIIFLTLLLSGCGTGQVITKTEKVPLIPPQTYYSDREIPEFTGTTNEDLVGYVDKVVLLLKELLVDRDALRQWAEDNQ